MGIKISAQFQVMALFILLIMFSIGCQPAAEEVGVLPTVMVLPTETATDTPTNTPLATETATSTSTTTPTNTVTPTNTLTATPRATSTSSITPTPTITPTFTSTPTPPGTSTPLASVTANAPTILSFTANANAVAPNTSITLSWNTQSDTARIDQLNQQGAVVQTFSVIPVGTLPVTVPGNLGRVVVYRLAVQRGGQEVTFSLAITVQCSNTWFFGDQFAPPNAGCPAGAMAQVSGNYQPFERGYMIAVNYNGSNTVYGLVNQDTRYISYLSAWDGTTVYDCSGAAPSGLFAAQGIFDWTYCNMNAPVGVWAPALGWATAAINNDQRRIQFEEGNGAFYIDSPVGVFRFSAGSGTWTKIT